jgi:tetratricopeptide (TPR) repeat protein
VLCDLHQRILRQDPELVTPPTASALIAADPSDSHTGRTVRRTSTAVSTTSVEPARRPAQLPLDVAGFTGRADGLRRLDELLLPDVANDRTTRGVEIAAIRGTAGVGKTALAVHWAHRVAHDFPDGQLYVNLRGYDPDQPMRPTDALARFLVALGVPEREIPPDGDERAARFRSELAGRRMLIVLDNAGNVAQVRPLLPGSGSSTVVVTSRDSLAGLVAVHGAHQVDLDLLPTAEAVDLLRRMIGSRVEAEPEAAVTLAEQCARLPLALRVAAVLATSRPDRPLAETVADLADRQERLELLDPGGDPYAAVHAVLSWSVQHLPGQVARTFRRLGLHPGPDLDQYVAAALTGLAPDRARRVLETLVSAHLLHRVGFGRYGMHDLLRAYAAHLTLAEETAQDREVAEERLFAYYLAAAVATMDTLRPAETFYRPEESSPSAPVPDLATPDAARGWVAAERPCIVAIAERAADIGRFDCVVGLARILHLYLINAHITDVLTINGHALRAAEAAGDTIGQAHTLRQLGVVHTRMGQHDKSFDYLRRARALFQQSEDLAGEAMALTGLGSARYQLGEHKAALDDHLNAVALARQAGDRRGEAVALSNVGIVQGRLGDDVASIERQYESLRIVRELGSRQSEAVTLNNLASVEMRMERYAEAADHLREALAIIEDLGSDRGRAHALDTLGILHLRLGEPGPAADCFQRALAEFRVVGERVGQAWSTNGLGEVARFTGDAAASLALHADALTIATSAGGRYQQARAHAGIGHAHRALGDPDRARTHYEHAYLIYTELDMPDAADMVELMGEAPAA